MSHRNWVKRVSATAALVVPLSVGAVLAASPAQADTNWTINGVVQNSSAAAQAELPALEVQCHHEAGVVESAYIDYYAGNFPDTFVYWGYVICESARSVG